MLSNNLRGGMLVGVKVWWCGGAIYLILFSTTTPAQLLLKLFRIISKHRNRKVEEKI